MGLHERSADIIQKLMVEGVGFEREAIELRAWQRDAQQHIERLLSDKAELERKVGYFKEEKRTQAASSAYSA